MKMYFIFNRVSTQVANKFDVALVLSSGGGNLNKHAWEPLK